MGRPGAGQPGSVSTGEGASLSKGPVGQKRKPHVPKKLEELPYRQADGKWTCTFSTGGMNKNKYVIIRLARCHFWPFL